jgi:2-polyprenyl-3-methyl-5-hydroxy-6-metoxy-1,4-benzoquinol methylase
MPASLETIELPLDDREDRASASPIVPDDGGAPPRGFERRHRVDELMDDPAIDEQVHRSALRGLARLNFLSGSAARIWRPIYRMAKAQGLKRITLVDIATGGGDVPIALARFARRAGIELEATGIDRSQQALDFAQVQAQRKDVNVDFRRLDVLNEELPGRFDVAICSLFLHHLREPDAVRVLRAMKESAKRLAVVNDLARSRLVYAQVWLASRIVSRSRIVRLDGQASVRAAFTVAEALELARQAGVQGAAAKSTFPCRFLLTWSPPSDS